jgi:hypothetical protein
LRRSPGELIFEPAKRRDNVDGLINDQLNSRLQELIESHVNNLRDDFQRLIGELPLQPPQESDAQQVADALACLKESVDSIHASRSQREMAERLLDAASSQAARVALFVVRDGACQGFKSRGFETSGEAFADVEMNPAAGDPLAASIAMRETMHLHGNSLAESMVTEWLEGAIPTQVCLAPIAVGDKAVGLLYADSGPDTDHAVIHPEAVDILASVAGLFLERMRRTSSTQPESAPAESMPSHGIPAVVPEQQSAAEPIPEPCPGDVPMPAQPDPDSGPAMVAGHQTIEERISAASFDEEMPGEQAPQEEAAPDLSPVPDFSEPLPEEQPDTAEVSAEPFAEPEPAKAAATEAATLEPTAPQPAEDPFARTIPVAGWGMDPMPTASDQSDMAPPPEPMEPAEPMEPEPAQAEQVDEDAMRFARLLVSEIVLYNEAQVKASQKQGDLYERLKESIERSREAYQERFGASTLQYFEDEIIRTLALGDASLMGSGYRGA